MKQWDYHNIINQRRKCCISLPYEAKFLVLLFTLDCFLPLSYCLQPDVGFLSLVHSVIAYKNFLPLLWSLICSVAVNMQIYAGSFFAIPFVRWFFVQRTNERIEKRNKARELRARALELPDLSLRRKVII